MESTLGLDGTATAELLGRALNLPVLSHGVLGNYTPAFDVVSYSDASAHNMVLLRTNDGNEWVLGVSDPLDTALQARVMNRVKGPLALAIIHPAELVTYLADQERALRAVDQFVDSQFVPVDEELEANHLDLASIGRDSSPAVRTVNSTLFDALNAGASDIHFEASTGGMAIKYRIDGVLLPATQVTSRSQTEQIISRIKVLAELDISERRVPQDGKFRVSTKDRRIDIRVSIMPSVFGEDAVLRILDRSALSQRFSSLHLEDLGFFSHDIAHIRKLSCEPYGMLLVTGPTGSGKTTTLYAGISEINTGRDKIITIEDPVEYHLDGVLQIPVNERKGLTFARGLRSILRHDPDKILVGEIRDTETAQIAVQSALTGHAVFTTVHANNALDVVGRVVNMGVDAYSFLSALNGIVGQRLVRKLCRHCAEPDLLSAERGGVVDGHASYRRGRGCAQCRGTGFRGRRAIAEIVFVDDVLRAALLRRDSPADVKCMLQERGVTFLRQQALLLAAMGETTLEEVDRVTLAA
ncbi:MAG: type II/IV secretion system protein [Betaproteobacteria bacterium]|nr:MAG: type II/IV secretion system protein [Betaproteobacteria bacterium]